MGSPVRDLQRAYDRLVEFGLQYLQCLRVLHIENDRGADHRLGSDPGEPALFARGESGVLLDQRKRVSPNGLRLRGGVEILCVHRALHPFLESDIDNILFLLHRAEVIHRLAC